MHYGEFMEKELIIKLAKESGLIFNTDLLQSEVYPHHRKQLYTFTKALEQVTQEKLAERFDDPIIKANILAKI